MHVPVILQRHMEVESALSPDKGSGWCRGWTLNVTCISGEKMDLKNICYHIEVNSRKGQIQFLRHILRINRHTGQLGGLSDLFILHFDTTFEPPG